ncbi:helix-turn-helix domain-containing protein [Rhizobium leguminosarum]|uniref:helix-turn-helix domain-containing protein n=1 Tax=Rhizobium leguminosarum TaxID=384 RepID=UPI003F9A54FD
MTGESQKALAARANVTENVLKLLENPDRKQPDPENLKRVKVALEAKGIVFLPASEAVGDGVRFASAVATRDTTEFFRYARALLDLSIDEMAELSGVGRISIGRIERNKLTRTPEDAVKKIRQVIFDKGVAILPEEPEVGGGVRFRTPELVETKKRRLAER